MASNRIIGHGPNFRGLLSYVGLVGSVVFGFVIILTYNGRDLSELMTTFLSLYIADQN